MVKLYIVILLLVAAFRPGNDFDDYVKRFAAGFQDVNSQDVVFDYREYFNSIPDTNRINSQVLFFENQLRNLSAYERARLAAAQKITFDHLLYEIDFNLMRLRLEKEWVVSGRKIPVGGLKEAGNEWYACFIQKFTTLQMKPDEIMKYGLEEVKRVNREIDEIQKRNNFSTRQEFYSYLQSGPFYITDKKEILKLFHATDSAIRSNLSAFVNAENIPAVHPMEWPGAGKHTPPGIYLNRKDNSYGKDVFQYNFHDGRFNSRAIDWIYMHEGIPGHHLQSTFRNRSKQDALQGLFSYSGNFEGWACYVEDEGRKLGVYRNDFSFLGKWEWDLVRSARLVLETGIHYYGWSQEEAMKYWKDNIYGQDDIAEREITRVTNWPGQALSYKLGAQFIEVLKEKCMNRGMSEREFHTSFLSLGMRPLTVIERHLMNHSP